MSDAKFSGIPATLLGSLRATAVPRELRAEMVRLGVSIALEVEVPEGASLSGLALQLVRLACEGGALHLATVRSVPEAAATTRLRFVRGARELVVETGDLAAGPPALLRRLAAGLLDIEEAGRALEGFAREAPRQDALRRLTRAMLETSSVDRLRTIMLIGMTSGHALGFGRAALFVYDEDGRALVGVSAVGPADEAEAQRQEEASGRQDKALEALIAEAAASEVEQRFEAAVREIAVDVTPDPRDEVGIALQANGPEVFSREGAINPAITALDPAGEFLVCAIKLRGKPIGVVVADNRYSGAKIDLECLDFVGFLLDTFALASENLRLIESVETLARHDALTGLFNRREFETRMAEEQSRSQRLGSQCGLILLDVDHLQRVNDERGHKAGDELLQSIGVLLRSTLRAHDIVARFAGDEFAVLVTDTNAGQILSIARRIGSQALGIGVSVSVGGSVWPRENQEMSVLFAEADAALWEAKRRGRGRAIVEGVAGTLVFTPPDEDETLFS